MVLTLNATAHSLQTHCACQSSEERFAEDRPYRWLLSPTGAARFKSCLLVGIGRVPVRGTFSLLFVGLSLITSELDPSGLCRRCASTDSPLPVCGKRFVQTDLVSFSIVTGPIAPTITAVAIATKRKSAALSDRRSLIASLFRCACTTATHRNLQ
jgi:hypothetical protein